jgi:hypothetical protein
MSKEAIRLSAIFNLAEEIYKEKKVIPWTEAIEEALAKQERGEPVALDEYDAGLLNDYGGGNVAWWQDYIRAELGRAYEHYQSQMPTQDGLLAVIKSNTDRQIEWDNKTLEERWLYHEENACPHCGGSGHKDDVEELKGQEPVDSDLLDDARAVLEIIVHDQPAETFRDARALIPKLRERLGLPPIINFTHPQPKREPLTVEQLRQHWQVAKVLDMTDAEIDFADYVLIARDVEALYGIKGEA